MACNLERKGDCKKGGFKQIPVNKNTKDSKNVLESFIRTIGNNEACWQLSDGGCWLLPNGESWLIG